MTIPSCLPTVSWPLLPATSTTASAPVDPSLLHLEQGWTPQGQGYDGTHGRDELLTTYYYDDRFLTPWDDSEYMPIDGRFAETGVLLSIQDRESGQQTQQVTLLGKDGGAAPAHGGGVSTDGEYVYVADSGQTYVYSRALIDAAQVNPDTGRREVAALHVFDIPGLTQDQSEELVSSASYLAVHDGHAYVGGYSKDGDGRTGAVWRYDINADGSFVEPPHGPIKAPDRAQGVTVVEDDAGNPALLFSTGDRKLVYQPITSPDQPFAANGERHEVDNGQLDSWAQGINIIDGQLYVTYESGSWQYQGEDGRQDIQTIPLEDLDDFPS